MLIGIEIISGNNEKYFGLITDKKLSFDVHIKSLFKKTSQKLNTLARISNLLTVDQTFLLINSGVTRKFNCCTLRWMFYLFSLNNPRTHYLRKCTEINS